MKFAYMVDMPMTMAEIFPIVKWRLLISYI